MESHEETTPPDHPEPDPGLDAAAFPPNAEVADFMSTGEDSPASGEPSDATDDFPERPPPPPRPPRHKPPRTWPIFLGVVVVAAVVIALVYFFGPGSELLPFKSHIMEYSKTQGLKQVIGPPPGIVGKVIILNADLGEIDMLTFRLPEDIRPRKHKEVGSVVIHRREPAKEFGHYTEDQLAYVQVRRLIFIDIASGTLYQWMDIDGPPPRAKVQTGEGDQIGPPPRDEIIEAIDKLNRIPKR